MATSPDLFQLGLADVLAPHQRILIAGAGGGFDIFAGLPLYFSLVAAGKDVFLANLSFSYLGGSSAEHLARGLWRVDHTDTSSLTYFPERFLAEWLHQNGYSSNVYAFDKIGVRPLREAYEILTEHLEVTALVLVDGGTDILMRGDEAGLGTPAEDMTSLAATRYLPLQKVVSCLGFGIDAFHGICHAQFLENVAALERVGGYLGAHSIQLRQPSVAKFRDAVEYAHSRMPDHPSIVNGSIVSALEGHFGNHQRTERTRSSQLFINPLMALYWHFDLETLADQSLYLEDLEETDDIFQVLAIIEAFRRSISTRPRTLIPV